MAHASAARSPRLACAAAAGVLLLELLQQGLLWFWCRTLGMLLEGCIDAPPPRPLETQHIEDTSKSQTFYFGCLSRIPSGSSTVDQGTFCD